MIAGIFALFAEFEHETIREQMAGGRLSKWKNNNTFVGRPPFGYHWDGKSVVIDPTEAKIYKRIVTMYVDQRMSFSDITIQLNREGLYCKASRRKKD